MTINQTEIQARLSKRTARENSKSVAVMIKRHIKHHSSKFARSYYNECKTLEAVLEKSKSRPGYAGLLR